MASIEHKGRPVGLFADRAAWDGWLLENADTSPGLWLMFAKKGAGTPTVTKAEAVETALCHGWIDGQLDRWDEQFFLTRFTPRGPKSLWSEVNRIAADALIASGRMTQRGLAEVERARADGRWNAAYPPQSRATVPDDLQAALDADPAAAAAFAALGGQRRYAVLHRVHTASAKARAGRIAKFIGKLARGEPIG